MIFCTKIHKLSIHDYMQTHHCSRKTIKIAKQQLGETVAQLTNIPSGTGKPLHLVYPSPLNAKEPTKTVRSEFSTILGKS